MPATISFLHSNKTVLAICLGIFAFLLPVSWFVPVGRIFADGVLPMYVTPAVFATDFGIVAVLVGALIRRNRWGQFPRIFQGIFWPLVGIAAVALLTAPFSLVPGLAWYTALRWLLAVVLFAALYLIDVPTQRIVVLLLVSFALQAVVGLGQAALQRPLGLPGEMTLPLSNHDSAAIYFAGLSWLRSYGLTFHPNVLGGYLMVGTLLALPWLRHRLTQALWVALVAGLLFTFSRSAWLATGVALAFSVMWFLRRRMFPVKKLLPLFLVVVAGGAFAMIFFFPQIVARINPFATFSEFTSLSARGEMIDIALHSIWRDPLTGLGAGNFPVAMMAYPTLDSPHYVHNVILLLASEVGVLGGLIWIWLWAFPVAVMEPHLRRKSPWPVIFTLAWFAWGLVGIWDSYPWALETGRLGSVTLLALVARAARVEDGGGDE